MHWLGLLLKADEEIVMNGEGVGRGAEQGQVDDSLPVADGARFPDPLGKEGDAPRLVLHVDEALQSLPLQLGAFFQPVIGEGIHLAGPDFERGLPIGGGGLYPGGEGNCQQMIPAAVVQGGFAHQPLTALFQGDVGDNAVSTVSASRAVRASLSPAGIGIQQVIRQVADRLEFSTSSTCVRPPREVRWLLA